MTLLEHYVGLALCGVASRIDLDDAKAVNLAMRLASLAEVLVAAEQARRAAVERSGHVKAGEVKTCSES